MQTKIYLTEIVEASGIILIKSYKTSETEQTERCYSLVNKSMQKILFLINVNDKKDA